ncbi:MAG: hypothetical protein ABEH60_05390 [Halonotius sp.]
MPSTNLPSRVFGWLTTQRNLTILVAICIALPTAYGFRMVVDGADSGGSFLLLMSLGVGIPSAYANYGTTYDRVRNAVAWVILGCIAVTATFTSLYLVGTELGDLSHFLGGNVAFVITNIGLLAWLLIRKRRRDFGG